MLRQHIDTAPIWESYHTDCECPLCLLRAKTQSTYVENFLGGSVMEPAVRIEVNQKGFCREHLKMLYDAGNRLGLALMADTHMQETIKRLKAQSPSAPAGRFRFGAKNEQAPSLAHSCILCDRLENTMLRYEETLLYMWKTDPAFRETFEKSKGLCLEHYERLRDMAREKLGGKEQTELLETAFRITVNNLERVEKDLNWFTLKFDYRNQDKPWGNSRDAVERALIKLRGGTAQASEMQD